MKTWKTILLGSLFAVATSSQAALYTFQTNPGAGGSLGDQITDLVTTYDDLNERFTFDVDFSGAQEVDGFWLVVNAGGNPKSADVNELAIIYGDMETGIASTYAYNGQNNANSINTPGILLDTTTFSAVEGGGFELDMDVSGINSWNTADTAADYAGIQFDSSVGIWFHYSTGSNFGYTNGDITSYSFARQGWYDVGNRATEEGTSPVQASSPATIALVGLSLLALGMRRKISK